MGIRPGTLSETTKSTLVVQEVLKVRKASTSGRADNDIVSIYNLLNRAAAVKDVDQGGLMVRRQLPGLTRAFIADYPAARARLLAADVHTKAGVGFRDIALYVLDQDRKLFPALNADVVRSPRTWSAVERFSTAEDTFRKHSNARINKLLQELPPSERRELEQAVREMSG